MTRIHHFFGNREHGVAFSTPEALWRSGKGNVFPENPKLPSLDKKEEDYTVEEREQLNAIQNLRAWVEKEIPSENSGSLQQVILNTRYGKGITKVDEEFLKDNAQPRDVDGRIVIDGDGLFTSQENILLLNRSADAHSIIMESPTAIGILVGSWQGISKGLIGEMQIFFVKSGVDPKDITVRIGPGLGKESYDVGKDVYEAILKENPEFAQAFTFKKRPKVEAGKSSKPLEKYMLDMVKLVEIACLPLGITINTSEAANTFPRAEWHEKREEAKKEKNGAILTAYYSHLPHFGARLDSRIEKYIKKFAAQETWDSTAGAKAGTYRQTGRCVNGVIKLTP